MTMERPLHYIKIKATWPIGCPAPVQFDSEVFYPMEQGEIFDEVASAIRSAATMAGPITPETSILRDLSLDSVAVMDLIMTLETRFDTVIPMNRMTDIETVGDLVAVLAMGAPATASSAA